jgi:hypothetical protein
VNFPDFWKGIFEEAGFWKADRRKREILEVTGQESVMTHVPQIPNFWLPQISFPKLQRAKGSNSPMIQRQKKIFWLASWLAPEIGKERHHRHVSPSRFARVGLGPLSFVHSPCISFLRKCCKECHMLFRWKCSVYTRHINVPRTQSPNTVTLDHAFVWTVCRPPTGLDVQRPDGRRTCRPSAATDCPPRATPIPWNDG